MLADETAVAVVPGPDGLDPPHRTRRRRVLTCWRSPPDQPRWARPALLMVAALAALSYAWGITNASLEPFYGAAARSMSENWHNFIFGAFDPWGTVSVDKLPGSLWIQALSIHLFGFHTWAVVLPQVIEGTLTLLVLFRAVRRVAGPGAGLIAAVVVAASPVTILLNRGNISDSLLLLLLVLSADAATKACITGRGRSLVMAGVWVGLAFQTKMLQAWLVLPALYLAYLIAAPAASFLRRLSHIALSGLVVVVVSLSWMTAISVVPAHDRPYVDGSCTDNVFKQVFLYNGLDRIAGHSLAAPGCNPPSQFLLTGSRSAAEAGLNTGDIHSGWNRLLKGVFGRDDAWLLAPTLVAAVGLILRRWRRPRTDPLRASVVLWSTWLALTFTLFSAGTYLNSYYVAALVPAMAALCGIGAVAAWEHRVRSKAVRAVVAVTAAGTVTYAIALVPDDAGVRGWVIGSMLTVGIVAVGILVASLWRRHTNGWTTSVGMALAAVAMLLGSAWAAGIVVPTELGPFDAPYAPVSINLLNAQQAAQFRAAALRFSAITRSFPTAESIITLETSYTASYDILVSGREFLPVGGFTGTVPSPSLAQFIRDVAQRRVVRVVVAVSPRTRTPDLRWVIAHCRDHQSRGEFFGDGATFHVFVCSPADARSG